jgi:hypothetical protein
MRRSAAAQAAASVRGAPIARSIRRSSVRSQNRETFPLRVQVLAQRLRRHQPFQFADHLGVPARREVELDRALGGAQPQVVEAADLRGGERLAGDVGERVAPPQGERLAGA